MKSISGKTIKLLPFQERIIKKIKPKKDYLLIGPTGSGKSIIMYYAAGLLDPVTFNEEYNKVIICSPIKALSNERYLELKKEGFDVGIETGDIKVNNGARILCVTQEIYLLKYCKIKNCTVVIDEIHYMFSEPERSKAYMDSINFTSKSSRLILLSATIKKPEDFIAHINNLTGRNIEIVSWNTRPVPLEYDFNGLNCKDIQNAIVFAFSVKDIDNIVKNLIRYRKQLKQNYQSIIDFWRVQERKEWKYGIGVYHGKLLPKEKHCVEELFRSGYLDIIVGTDALALGVNLPAKYVVFSSITKSNTIIVPSLFKQLSGRAGRYGYHKIGIVTFLKDLVDSEKFSSLCKKTLESVKIQPVINLAEFLKAKDISTLLKDIEKYWYPKIEGIDIDLDTDTNALFYAYETIKYEAENSKDYKLYLELIHKYCISELGYEENICLFKILTEAITLAESDKTDISLKVWKEIHNKEKFPIFSSELKNDGRTIRFFLLLRRLFKELSEDSIYSNLIFGNIFEDQINKLDHTVLNFDI